MTTYIKEYYAGCSIILIVVKSAPPGDFPGQENALRVIGCIWALSDPRNNTLVIDRSIMDNEQDAAWHLVTERLYEPQLGQSLPEIITWTKAALKKQIDNELQPPVELDEWTPEVMLKAMGFIQSEVRYVQHLVSDTTDNPFFNNPKKSPDETN